MKCNIIFELVTTDKVKVEGKKTPQEVRNVLLVSIPIESESAKYPSYLEIIEALKKDPEKFLELYNLIEYNYNNPNLGVLDIEETLKNKGLVGNTTIELLAKKYDTLNWPEGVSANILLVDNVRNGGKHMSGRYTTSNGEEIFIIRNSENLTELRKLVAFLNVRKKIEDNANLINEESEYYTDLENLRKKYKKDSIAELLVSYLEDKSKYRKGTFINSQNKTVLVMTLLEQVTRDIYKTGPRVLYYNDFFNDFRNLLSYITVKGDTKAVSNFEDLYLIFKVHYSELLSKLEIKSFETFKLKMLDESFDLDILKEFSFIKTIYENKPLIYTILNNIINLEPKFNYEVGKVNDNKIELTTKFSTLKSLYDFAYDNIQEMKLITTVSGYKIYEFFKDGKKQYIYSRNHLTENTPIYNIFETLEQAENEVRAKALKEKLSTLGFLKLKFRFRIDGVFEDTKYIDLMNKSKLVFNKGDLIDVLDIKIDPLTSFKIKEEERLKISSEATVLDIHNLVNSWNISQEYKDKIISKLDNAEKAIAYLYKINEILSDNRSDEELLLSIADDIYNSGTLSYYINSFDGKTYSLIYTDPLMVEEYKKDRSYPLVSALIEMKKVLEEKTGTTVELMTSDEISRLFPPKDFPAIDPNTSKAFIYNGVVHINTTIASKEDLLHEYSHLMLSVLKSNPETRKRYEELMYLVYKLTSKSNTKDIDQIRRLYPNLTELDLLEELFVSKFSNYLIRQTGNNEIKEINDLFLQNEEFLKEGIKSIFDLVGEEPLPVLYNLTLDIMFKKFSTDISAKLSLEGGLDLELITNSRRKTNWINKQLGDTIILDCV